MLGHNVSVCVCQHFSWPFEGHTRIFLRHDKFVCVLVLLCIKYAVTSRPFSKWDQVQKTGVQKVHSCILWSNRRELWGFFLSASIGNLSRARAYRYRCPCHTYGMHWHCALCLLHLYCVQLCTRFSMSIHNVNLTGPVFLVMIIV